MSMAVASEKFVVDKEFDLSKAGEFHMPSRMHSEVGKRVYELNHHGVPSRIDLEGNFVRVMVPENMEEIREQFRRIVAKSGFIHWHLRTGKEKIIRAGWGDKVPDYLWYDARQEERTTVPANVIEEFFPEEGPSFGDVEWHRSELVQGNVLRIRHAQSLKLSLQLRANGPTCPLYLVGHFDDLKKGGKYINFTDLQPELENDGLPSFFNILL